jgi:hypothetical protein
MSSVRWLLVIMLVNGVAPGIAEAVEAGVHFARTGHVAHSFAGEDDLGEQGPEHSCGTTFHNCDCCTASPSTAAALTELSTPTILPLAAPRVTVRGFARRALEPPFRPPIR